MAYILLLPRAARIPANDEITSSVLVLEIKRTLAFRFVIGSRTVIVDDSTFGPVIAMGASCNPFRKHASAAAVAIGPGIPLTMTYISSTFRLLSVDANVRRHRISLPFVDICWVCFEGKIRDIDVDFVVVVLLVVVNA